MIWYYALGSFIGGAILGTFFGVRERKLKTEIHNLKCENEVLLKKLEKNNN